MIKFLDANKQVVDDIAKAVYGEINAMVLPLDAIFKIAGNGIKSKEQDIERIKQQAYSRDKLKNYTEQCQKIVESNEQLQKMIKPFNKSKDDYEAEAEQKYNEKMKKLTS